MEGLLGGMALLLGMSAFLSFIKTQLSILLPIGIALRAFPFSRPAGGALIAVFLGFYVFFPFLWIFDKQIYSDVSPTISPITSSIANALGLGSNCNECPMCCTTNTPDWGGNMFMNIVSSLTYPSVYYLFIFVLLLPLFDLIMVLILINELAKIFGSEIDISGLSGLI
jgi:hypothetical protein